MTTAYFTPGSLKQKAFVVKSQVAHFSIRLFVQQCNLSINSIEYENEFDMAFSKMNPRIDL